MSWGVNISSLFMLFSIKTFVLINQRTLLFHNIPPDYSQTNKIRAYSNEIKLILLHRMEDFCTKLQIHWKNDLHSTWSDFNKKFVMFVCLHDWLMKIYDTNFTHITIRPGNWWLGKSAIVCFLCFKQGSAVVWANKNLILF